MLSIRACRDRWPRIASASLSVVGSAMDFRSLSGRPALPRLGKRILVGFSDELKSAECRIVMTPFAMLQ